MIIWPHDSIYHKSFLFWPTHIVIYLKFFLDNMNIIKHQTRNWMRDDRITDCLVIYIDKCIFIDIEMKKSYKVFIIWKIVKDNYYCYKFLYMVPPLFKNLKSVTDLLRHYLNEVILGLTHLFPKKRFSSLINTYFGLITYNMKLLT